MSEISSVGMLNVSRRTILMTVCIVTFLTTPVFAAGFRIFDQDASATQRGDAFVATADNAAAVFFNPAGIMQIDSPQVRGGLYVINVDVDYTAPRSGTHTENKLRVHTVPQLFISTPLPKTPLAFGVGIYSTYGLSLTYPDNAPFRSSAKAAQIIHSTGNPVVAWQVTPTLAVSAGPTFVFSKAKLFTGIVTPGDGFSFAAEGEDVGAAAGVLWKPNAQHSFGISFHSSNEIRYSGHTNTTVEPFVPASRAKLRLPEEDADATVQFPAFLIAGYSYRPTPAWNIEVGVDWTDWDSLNEVTIHQQFSADVALPFNYHSSIVYRGGVTWSFSNSMHLSGGYQFAENSVPDSTYSPVVPDANRHVFALGVGRHHGKWRWDFAYQLAYQPSRSVHVRSSAAGNYQLTANALMLSGGWSF
jgi:long-chain fatty acid transport protein